MELKLVVKVGGNKTFFETNWTIKICEWKKWYLNNLKRHSFLFYKYIAINLWFKDYQYTMIWNNEIMFIVRCTPINPLQESGVDFKYLSLLIFILWGTPHRECSIDVSLFFVIFRAYYVEFQDHHFLWDENYTSENIFIPN